MDILVHRIHSSEATNDYKWLLQELSMLFSDLVCARRRDDEYDFVIDIFDVHVVFKYRPLETWIGNWQPEYYYSDDYRVINYLKENSCSIELCQLTSVYNIIIQRGRKMQYAYSDHSVELRFKLLDIAQRNNFDLLFHKCIGYVDRYYEAIFKNNNEEFKVEFYMSYYPEWDDTCFEDLEKRIIMDLVNKEENNMNNNKYDMEVDNGINVIDKYMKGMIYEVGIPSLHPTLKKEVAAEHIYNGVPEIKKVIFNDPATIVLWKDGTKTVVKAQDKEEFDKEKGLAMAISKKSLGNEGQYYDTFKKWLKEETR